MTALQDKHWSWFEEEVNRHYLKFTQKCDINIFIGTWNVNGKEPKESIKSWLFDTDSNFNADMYVCGFQEIVDLNNAANLLLENTANQAWEKLIRQSLGSQFVQIASRHLVGILLCIYVHKNLRSSIQNIMTSTIGVGLFGTGGNKGGVGISMQIYDSDICFICTHLAAHKNNVDGRNQDYLKIIENLKFTSLQLQQAEEKDMNANDGSLLSVISDHDMIFWLGDLNYRLNFDDLQYVLSKVREKDWKHLLSLDQLNVERSKQRAFVGFIEPEINFDPTYKFQPGTSIYEQRPDKKKRFPAWCDRILWRSGLKKTTNISDVKCLKYWISMEQKQSDHKPVFAHLKYAANIFNNSLRNEMRKEIMKNKDKSDNSQLPQLEIETEVSFPFIKFGETEHKKHMMYNTGHVAACFRFSHTNALPKWLTISPNYGIIKPKEKIGITFQICITTQNIKYIQPNGYKLKQTVLLRIENASEVQVPMKVIVITAKYLISCFGNKIENLIKYRKPIRFIDDIYDIDINKKQIKKQIIKYDDHNGEGDIDDDEFLTCIETTLSIPKELWRLVNHLYRYGMDCDSIFITRGINTEISLIRECLDTGKAFTRYDLHSVGEALIRFLESLQDPIFPYSLCQSFNTNNDNIDITQWCKQALMTLPLSHYNVFIYIISFLRDILTHSQNNRLTPEKLAYQFSSALMQVSVKDVNQLASFKPFKILRHLLSKDLFL